MFSNTLKHFQTLSHTPMHFLTHKILPILSRNQDTWAFGFPLCWTHIHSIKFYEIWILYFNSSMCWLNATLEANEWLPRSKIADPIISLTTLPWVGSSAISEVKTMGVKILILLAFKALHVALIGEFFASNVNLLTLTSARSSCLWIEAKPLNFCQEFCFYLYC